MTIGLMLQENEDIHASVFRWIMNRAVHFDRRNIKAIYSTVALYDIVDGLNVKVNKQAFKNRIAYIIGRKDSQIDCY